MGEALNRIKKPFTDGIKPFSFIMVSLYEYFEEYHLSKQQCELLIKSGWVPHYTTPFENLEKNKGNLSQFIENHYKNHWQDTKKIIQNKIEFYEIDDEAKMTTLQSLEIHEAQFYKAVPRVLFPEIERVVRNKFRHKNNFFNGIASLPDLRNNIENISITDIERDKLFTFTLLEMLEDHFYKRCKTFSVLEEIKKDPIPNRHATIHGYAPYCNFQNSLNSIFIADFIFYLLPKAQEKGSTRVAPPQ